MGAAGSNAATDDAATYRDLQLATRRYLFKQPPNVGPHDAYGEVEEKYKPWSVPDNNIGKLLEPGIKQSEFRFSLSTANVFDPADGCDKDLETSYVCGTAAPVNKKLPPPVHYGSEIVFDCNSQVRACEDYRFEVTTDGSVLFTYRGGRHIKSHFNTEPTANTNNAQNSGQPTSDIEKINQMVLNNALPGYMNFKRKYKQYMYPGDSLGPGEYICSNTGNCFFGLDPADSKFKMFTIKIRSNKKPVTVNDMDIIVMEGSNDLGTNISGALYELNGVDISNRDKFANISIDGKKRMFGSSALKLGDKYNEIINTEPSGRKVTYDNPGNDLETITNESMDINYCFDRCSARPDCGGFVVDNTDPDKCFLKDKDIFPRANRVRDVDKKLYKRLYTPQNVSESCMKPDNKNVVAIDSILLDHYPRDEKNSEVTRDTLCGTDQLLSDPSKRLSDIETGALDSFKAMITNRLNQAFNVMMQYDTIQNGDEMNVTKRIDAYDKINTKIKSILKKQDTIAGVEEDTYIQVVSETYKYIIWSIIAVVIIMVIVIYGDISNYTTNITNLTSTLGNFFKSSSSSSSSSSSDQE